MDSTRYSQTDAEKRRTDKRYSLRAAVCKYLGEEEKQAHLRRSIA